MINVMVQEMIPPHVRACESVWKRYTRKIPRGFVQITWKENYEKYTTILRNRFPDEDIDLVDNPDQAMEFKYALLILVDGFKFGRFTGKKISNYINSKKVDFRNARRCINGLDKATHIAKLAKRYL